MFKIIVILISVLGINRAYMVHDLDPSRTPLSDQSLYNIEGVILRPHRALNLARYFMRDISLSIDNGKFKGFVRLDGRFTISGVPNGSHILEVHHPDVHFQPVKVEITGKGKYRARKVSYVQPSLINQVPYPLRLQPLYRHNYFYTREQWRLTDVLLNPLVLSMVVPMLCMMILPKLISDPEAKELESIQFPKMDDIPDFSDMLSSYLSGEARIAKQTQKESAGRTRKKTH